MAHSWTFYPWDQPMDQDAPEVLRADDVIQTYAKPKQGFTVAGAVEYADVSYLACRVLMLANFELHREALYCAAQTLEKYMKAILQMEADKLQQAFDPNKLGHDLEKIANEVGEVYPEFTDRELLEICRRLQLFEVAGRYPNHKLKAWGYELNLLTFLDNFVAHCRELLGIRGGSEQVAHMLTYDPDLNPCRMAATLATAENNRRLYELAKYYRQGIDRLLKRTRDHVFR